MLDVGPEEIILRDGRVNAPILNFQVGEVFVLLERFLHYFKLFKRFFNRFNAFENQDDDALVVQFEVFFCFVPHFLRFFCFLLVMFQSFDLSALALVSTAHPNYLFGLRKVCLMLS